MFNHIARNVGKKVQQRINALKIGQKMQDLPEVFWHKSFKFYIKEDEKRNGGPNLRIIRLDPMKPALTVTGYIFNKFVHPFENRYITVREAARLQDFPDDFEFKGTLTSTQIQVGNAIPILLSTAIFNQICKYNSLQYDHLTGFSLFSGAGGFDIGASKAKYQNKTINTLLAIDIWNDACNSLQSYFKNLKVINIDICKINNPIEFWKQHTHHNDLPDIIYGGPPCQSFSQAGKQTGINDSRGVLIFEFIRFIQELRPKYFIMENVSNIKSINHGLFVQDIINKFNQLNYNVDFKILCSADFGSPQLRKRAIFIGTDKSLQQITLPQPTHAKETSFLNLKPYTTVLEAFRGLPKILN